MAEVAGARVVVEGLELAVDREDGIAGVADGRVGRRGCGDVVGVQEQVDRGGGDQPEVV